MKPWHKPFFDPDEEWPTYHKPPLTLGVYLAFFLVAISLIGIVVVLGGQPSLEVVRMKTELVQGD